MIYDHLNSFFKGMADEQFLRNPLSQEVIVIFNNMVRDHYQDTIITEVCRVKKRVMVKKNVDMHYVQEMNIDLLEDAIDELPWIVSITLTDLPRCPRMDDQVLIEGIKYTVSQVKPMNRTLDGVVLLSIYPERTVQQDPIHIFSVDAIDNYYSIVYGGYPIEMAFTKDAIEDKTKREPFRSYFVNDGWSKLLIFDKNNDYYIYSKA